MPGLHHIEIWIADTSEIAGSWAWILARTGFERIGAWDDGESWGAGGAYLTLTTSPNLAGGGHNRRNPGVNHLALLGGSPANVDAIMREAAEHGWVPLYHDRYPKAGGPTHYAGWLENAHGFKIEVVAEPEAEPTV